MFVCLGPSVCLDQLQAGRLPRCRQLAAVAPEIACVRKPAVLAAVHFARGIAGEALRGHARLGGPPAQFLVTPEVADLYVFLLRTWPLAKHVSKHRAVNKAPLNGSCLVVAVSARSIVNARPADEALYRKCLLSLIHVYRKEGGGHMYRYIYP